jgi:hypothetical protein
MRRIIDRIKEFYRRWFTDPGSVHEHKMRVFRRAYQEIERNERF